MARIPLLCPRCGRPQRVIPGGPERAARIVHADTGRDSCNLPDEPPGEQRDGPPGGARRADPV